MKKRCAAFVMALLLGLAACRMPASPDRPRLEMEVQVRVSTGERVYGLRLDCRDRKVFLDGEVVPGETEDDEGEPNGEEIWRLFPRREALREKGGYGWAGILI